MMKDLQKQPHKRLNILTNEWVLVSPHRTKRPWQGNEEVIERKDTISYDANCYLCPGNKRSNEVENPEYKDVYVFENDFAALNLKHQGKELKQGLLHAQIEKGICKVICFSPDHSKSLSNMEINHIKKVIKVWVAQYEELAQHSDINYVQIFENKGAIMGCSNPHPHGQIWSQSSLPDEVLKKDRQQASYYSNHNTSILTDYIRQELADGERLVYENDHFVILVPFWAVWPYETMIVPKEHQSHIGEMNDEQENSFAEAISRITKLYDAIFNCSFPYSSGIHQAPTDQKKRKHWHWHMSFYPPLLRSASVKKFMVGYEMLAESQRDLTAEQAAQKLRDVSDIHYKQQ